ncbi:hypothetical protein F4553_005271 [Allocatelliglobosispora scoriae]|uniref:Uncharacterized protein n=1 Tax=Allocatelliglobosispora scoriae TaxID=643052 RepID=A0A841BYL3_9ACTN|nr:hypothetical protein [Allocatelliglobosispora scoriae]MBB5871892.1 hypothetical protein [Allocatelliglobosispora scoriae]
MDIDSNPPRLPLRWLTILAVSAALGWALGVMVSPAVGFGTAIALAGLLHKISG